MNFEGKVIGLLFAMPWFILSAGAATNYVTPAGAGSANGTDWDNAYSATQLQAAIDACSGAGDEIRLRYGAYTNDTHLVITNRPGLTMRGGYFGDGETFTNDATVLAHNLAYTNRVIYATNSTLWLERLTLTRGNAALGAGLYLGGCNATVTNCTLSGNIWATLYPDFYNAKGGGIYAIGGSLTILGSLFQNCGGDHYGDLLGGGVYADGVTVVLSNCTFSVNHVAGNGTGRGAGAYLKSGSALVSGCAFNGNYMSAGYGHWGGGIYAESVNPLTITNCTFQGNWLSAFNGYARGAALGISGSTPFQVADCVFANNSCAAANASPAGHTMYLDGSTRTGEFVRCDITGPSSGAAIANLWVNHTANTLTIRDATMKGVVGAGVYKTGGGSIVLTNCLVTGFASHGVQVDAGTGIVAQCTVADNCGWGITNAAAFVKISDSIVWGNLFGGVSSTNGSVSYTCAQETLSGVSNMSANPLFVAGYYLSADGLLCQSADSPCINAGSCLAGDAAMDARTTRTDGGSDTNAVDLGYHTTNGVATSLSNMVLYVNVTTGDDTNNGWSAASPLKTIKTALSRSLAGSTINIATGRYCWGSGEVFPLTSVYRNLTLKGTNRADTVLDACLTNRVFSANGQGDLWFEGLTLANGDSATGGGLYLPGCRTTITNCLFFGNRRSTYSYVYGCGIHANAGTLRVVDSVMQNNWTTVGMEQAYGGGIYAANAVVTLENVILYSNGLKVNSGGYGAGVYLTGGSAQISGCSFNTNYMNQGYNHYGAGLAAVSVAPLTISNCTFAGNYASAFNGPASGGALWISGGSALRIVKCTFLKQSLTSNSGTEGNVMCLLGGLAGTIANCDITGQASGSTPENLSIDTTGLNTVAISNTIMRGGIGTGVHKKGSGTIVLVNCLAHSFSNHGLQVDGGTGVLVNATLAYNGGWGVSNTTGSVTGFNCIAWGNTNGGFTNCVLAYTCAQETHAGEANKNADPLFEGVATNNFQLRRTSPCVNSGLNENWMRGALDLAGNARIVGIAVDMGAYEMTSPPASGAMIVVK